MDNTWDKVKKTLGLKGDSTNPYSSDEWYEHQGLDATNHIPSDIQQYGDTPLTDEQKSLGYLDKIDYSKDKPSQDRIEAQTRQDTDENKIARMQALEQLIADPSTKTSKDVLRGELLKQQKNLGNN